MNDSRGNRRRVIRPQEAAEQWLPPDLLGDTPQQQQRAKEGKAPLLTAAQLEEMTRQAHEEGYEQGRKEGFEYGHNEGLEEGRKDMQQRVARFDALIAKLEDPFDDLDQQVEQEVVTLVIAMVRQLVRREVKADPGQVIGVVREALGVLPVNARRIRVLLHPEDAELVREAYALGESDQKWQIVEDPVIQRGGCRIYTENSQIDATLESRLSSLIAPLLSSERTGDEASEEAGTAQAGSDDA